MCNNHGVGADQPVLFDPSKMNRRDLVRGLWAGTIVLGASATTGCASTAAFFAPSDDVLIPMAAQAWADTKSQTPISRDPRANSRLQSVGQKIALAANRPNDAWEFVVFDSEEKNAFVLPGGKVGFYKGLMDFADNDDQVAAVLGHEVGHVTARHAALRVGQEQATQLGLAIAGAGIASTDKMTQQQKSMLMALAGAGATVGIILPFSRQNELDADVLGVDYMHTAGFDVREAVTLWEKMGGASDGRQPQWLSTHPNPGTRVQQLRQYINNRGYALV